MSFADLRSARTVKESKSFVPKIFTTTTKRDGNGLQEIPGAVPQGPLESKIPSSLQIVRDERTGRGLHVKSGVQAGTPLISGTPQISVISSQNLEAYCSYCSKGAALGSRLKRCSRCKQLWYCNATCQNSDWSIHKSECAAIQRWKSNAPSEDLAVPNEAVRCLGRIMWSLQREGRDGAWAREFNAMQSHRKTLSPTSVQSHTHLAHALVQYLGVGSPMELEPFGVSSAGDLVDLISRFTTNTFTLTTSSLTPIGICVSPLMALVNHSCEPNAVMVFPRVIDQPDVRPNMQLIAIKDIQQDEQVFASYIDVTLPKELRQRDLKETYNFDCECTLCSSASASVDPRASLWCPKSCGGTCPAPVDDDDLCRCSKCGAALTSTEAVVDAIRVGQEAIDKAIAVQFQDTTKARQLTTNMIPILTTAGLIPSSHPLLAMYRLHLELLVGCFRDGMSQRVLDDAIRSAAKYSAGLSNILPHGHPVRGVGIAELGKLLAVDEPSPTNSSQSPTAASAFPPSGPARLKLAHETLVRALEELRIGFGKSNGGGEVGKEVRETILGLEKELGIWTQGIRNVLADTRAARS